MGKEIDSFSILALDTGFIRLDQIIGREEVTPEQASLNRKRGRGPIKPRPAIAGPIPVGKTCWWEGVKSGRFPRPVKLGPRVTAWRVEDIRELIRSISEGVET